MNSIIQEKLKLLPDSPGVYKMFDKSGEVIYVGKAVSLKNRVRQYFQSSKTMHPKVHAMVSHIENFEYILTANETEALTLESNLIKHFMPRYNILLKDDKHFPYVRLNIKQDYPRFEVVRKIKNDGAKYFGPYLSAMALREALNVVREHFPVRHCKKDINKAIIRGERPCLMYHLGKCCAPCSGNVSREEYHEMLKNISAFLEGDNEQVVKKLTADMMKASDELEFEKAAKLRDSINAIKSLGEKQLAISTSMTERDVFAFASDPFGACTIFALFIRNGKVIGTQSYEMNDYEYDIGSIMSSFIKQFYVDNAYIPAEIVVHDAPDDMETIEKWLSDIKGKKVHIILPQRGEKLKQAQMAYKNGIDLLNREHELKKRQWERDGGAVVALSRVLELETVPERIECYDNSHIQGTNTVASMVVFENGKKATSEYRRFKIKQATGGDDYEAMREVLTRRFKRAENGDKSFSHLPDLLIVDGGRGQLNVALKVLEEFSLSFIPCIGLAEKNEEIVVPDRSDNIILERNDPALQLIERIRDEAHRFAITYHRDLRSKSMVMSELDKIEGIGEKRRKILYDKYTTLDEMKKQSIDELASLDGMNRKAAENVYAHFHEV